MEIASLRPSAVKKERGMTVLSKKGRALGKASTPFLCASALAQPHVDKCMRNTFLRT